MNREVDAIEVRVEPPTSVFERWASRLQLRIDDGRWHDVPWGATRFATTIGLHVVELRRRPWRNRGRASRLAHVRVDVRPNSTMALEVNLHTETVQLVD